MDLRQNRYDVFFLQQCPKQLGSLQGWKEHCRGVLPMSPAGKKGTKRADLEDSEDDFETLQTKAWQCWKC